MPVDVLEAPTAKVGKTDSIIRGLNRLDRSAPPPPPEDDKPPAIVENISPNKLMPKKVRTALTRAERLIPRKYEIDDEYHSPNSEVLKPKPGHSGLEKHFEYLSSTSDLEVSSDRVTKLQEIVDRMLVGTNKTARVVIANKGVELRGFVLPDGTVIVSQSLLNKLSSLDEVVGVLAHEIGHHVINSHALARDYSVRWLHEGAIDAKVALDLMAKVGYNPLAHADALEKIAGTGRGIEHMSGLTRGATVVASAAAFHYPTSSKVWDPLEAQFHRDVRPTNHEMLSEIISRQDIRNFKKILPKLHKKDFEGLRVTQLTDEFEDAVKETTVERLTEGGFTEEDRAVFMLLRMGGRGKSTVFDVVKDQQMLIRLVKHLENMETNETVTKMFDYLYGEGIYIGEKRGGVTHDFRRIIYDILDGIPALNGKNPNWVSFDEDVFLEILETFHNSESLKEQGNAGHLANDFTHLLRSYVGNIYVGHIANEKGIDLDTDRIRSLYQHVKELGIPIDKAEYFSSQDMNYEAFNYNFITENQLFKRQLADVFTEVFGRDVIHEYQRPEFDYAEIDRFFDEHQNQISEKDFSKFLLLVHRSLDYNVPDSERLIYIKHIYERIGELPLQSPVDLLKALENPNYIESQREILTPEIQDMNRKLMEFNLRTLTGFTLFNPEQYAGRRSFYNYMITTMEESNIDISQLSDNQLLNLCQGFFITGEVGREPKAAEQHFYFLGQNGISHFPFGEITVSMSRERALELPFITELAKRSSNTQFKSLEEVSNHFNDSFLPSYEAWSDYDRKPSMFGDDLYSLVMGRGMRESFAREIYRPITDENILDMHAIIRTHFPESPTKTSVLKELEQRYIKSDGFSFQQKMDYLERHLNSLGLEGAMILAEQIHTYPEFLIFRGKMGDRMQQELGGSTAVKVVAAAEILSTEFLSKFETLLSTANEARSLEETTKFVSKWIDYYDRTGDIHGVKYNPQSGRYKVDQRGVDSFESVSDIFEDLRNLSPADRYLLMQKALTDRDGALTSPENRKKLAGLAVQVLRLPDGFTSRILQATCQTIDAKYGGFSIARMLAPLLFKAYDSHKVDLDSALNTKVWIAKPDSKDIEHDRIGKMMTSEQLAYIVQTETRQIMEYGYRRTEDPNGLAAFLNRELDETYTQARDAIRRYLPLEVPVSSEMGGELDSGTDAVLTGLASLGAPVARGFQLSRQFYSFSPAMDRRLDRFYDQNPGVNNFLFWENLQRLSNTNTGLKQFLERDLVSLDETVGVGSLYTTKAAVIRDERGNNRRIVVKLLNPNAEAFVDRVYEEAKQIFTQVERTGSRADRSYISIARVANELSHEWCKKDINDETYAKDDADFRAVIAYVNAKSGAAVTFSAPETYFLSKEVKMEGFANGVTLNRLIYDNTVDGEFKKQAVLNYAKFYFSQFGAAPVSENGQQYNLLLSNPSVGNSMITTEGNSVRIGVIDRNLYLRLSPTALTVMQPLIEGDYPKFLNQFLDQMLGQIGRIDRVKVKAQIGREVLGQRMSGNADNFAVFRTALKSLQDLGVEVPLEYRLTIGNIESMKRLCERFGITPQELQAA